MARVAIVQCSTPLLNRALALESAVASIAEAAAGGAQLVVLPEAFLGGYPAWIWRLRPGGDMALCDRLHARLLESAVEIAGDDLQPIRDAARDHQVTVVCGMSERDVESSRSTLYNAVVVIGPDGAILNHHRKLMPTNPERMVWGFGDAQGLRVVDTPVGRIGALICWENYMPLARFALYAQGVEVYVAPSYDSGERWIATMQHIAREGGCWVLGSGVALRGRDVVEAIPELAEHYPNGDEWINAGDSIAVAPGGRITAGPLRETHGSLTCEIDLARVGVARRTLDVAGHYARPDVFQLQVTANRPQPLVVTKG